MLLPLPQLPDAWDALRGVATLPDLPTGASGPVLVFVAADVDSVAATRTLTALLKADLVRYEVHPVAGYAHLADSFKRLVDAAPRAVLCVNCGASVDVDAILGLADIEDAPPVYVMDSHRPFHIRNISSPRVVLLDDDEHFDIAALPIDAGWEDEWGNVSDHDLSDGSDSDSDASDEADDDDLSESERSVDSDAESAHSAESAAASDGDEPAEGDARSKSKPASNTDGDDGPTAKRSREESAATETESREVSTGPRRTKRRRSGEKDTQTSVPAGERKTTPRRRRRRKRRVPIGADANEKEALRAYYASSFLAMSSACLSHNLASTLRRSSVETLWMAIVGVTSQYVSAGVSDELYQDAVAYFRGQVSSLVSATVSADGVDSQDSVGYAAASTGDGAIPDIAASTELRLDLVRHWNLYDSLLHSSYTVARLGAWRQTGRRRLQELLATLGIPLKESKQRWCFMRAECKAALDDRLEAVVRRFDLGRAIQYDSFVRARAGHRGAVCAADVAAAVAALLELADGELPTRFWRAYDALDVARAAALDAGLSLAVDAQKLAAEVGGDVIERRKFVPSGPFRYVFLRDHLASRALLARPLLLRRLALFLIDALTRQGARDKPFVVLAPDADRGVWLAVAATSVTRKNDFGARFQKAAEKNGSQVVYSGFDSAVCEIRDGQEVEFIRFLHDVLR